MVGANEPTITVDRYTPNLLTIDVEEWFHLLGIPAVPPEDAWGGLETRVVQNTLRLLEILERHHVTGTFFVLGWVAKRFPELVREIDHRGHELATHGFGHQLLSTLTPQAFRDDVQRSLDTLAPLSSQPIRGYRAPGFSLMPETLWALDILLELGLLYDASLFPSKWRKVPNEAAQGYLTTPKGARILEFPATPVRLAGLDFFVSGGGYFRLAPYPLIAAALRQNGHSGKSNMVYLHPRDIDPAQPRLPMSPLRHFMSYINLSQAEAKFDRLLSEFAFVSIFEMLQRRLLPQTVAAPSPTPS
jgi:polysaccharide deacetylase family protein (PEP-CTERM system associated)